MFVGGVGVIISGTESAYVAMSIAWLTKIEEKHVLLSVPKDSPGTQALVDGGRFTLSLLSEHQAHIARLFGGKKQKPFPSSKAEVLFDACEGIPVLRDCCASFLCEIKNCQQLNSQILIIATLSAPIAVSDRPPLLYSESDYFQ